MPTYTITELAREFDITARAIRFYEDQGLISPKREGAGGRTRVYCGGQFSRRRAQCESGIERQSVVAGLRVPTLA